MVGVDACKVCTQELNSQRRAFDETYLPYRQQDLPPQQQVVFATVTKLKHRRKRKVCGCWQIFQRARGKTLTANKNQEIARARLNIC